MKGAMCDDRQGLATVYTYLLKPFLLVNAVICYCRMHAEQSLRNVNPSRSRDMSQGEPFALKDGGSGRDPAAGFYEAESSTFTCQMKLSLRVMLIRRLLGSMHVR